MAEEHLSDEKYNLGDYNYKYAFAKFPTVKMYLYSDSDELRNQLLFGDLITILDTEITNGRVRVRCRNNSGWVKTEDLQNERVLEINFIDGGEGDGCHMITPDNQNIIVDAGNSANMNHYLFWRFDLYRKEKLNDNFQAVITRNDPNYFTGFKHIFDNGEMVFNSIFLNSELLTTIKDNDKSLKFSDDLVNDHPELKKVLQVAAENNKNIEIIPVSTENGFPDQFSGAEKVNDKKFSIKVLSPVTDIASSVSQQLRLKVSYGNFNILLGGESDSEESKFFLDHYSSTGNIDLLESDVVQAGPLNKNTFNNDLIESTKSRLILFSTGGEGSDFENMDDVMSSLGENINRNKIPVVTTDLAHSKKEFNKEKKDYILERLTRIKETKDKMKKEKSDEELKILNAVQIKARKEIDSMITQYGMISLRTDGEKLVVAREPDGQTVDNKWSLITMEYSRETKKFEFTE